MFSYSALSLSKVLRDCLNNLEHSADPDDPAVVRLKRALLLGIAEVEARRTESDLQESSRLGNVESAQSCDLEVT